MDDNVLVEKMKAEDKESFDILYERYQNRLIRTAYLITGNYSDSEDIVQETFVKCYLHCNELKNNSGFKPWLYQILTRTAWQYGKKRSRELPDEEIEKKAERSDEINSLDLILKSEQSAKICEAVRKLDIKYRVVVVYYYYSQMSTKEIAKACELREGTVKSRLFAARKQLKKEMHEIMEKEELRDGKIRGKNHPGYV